MPNNIDASRPRVWMITGASRGVGAALVSQARTLGDIVVGVARSPGPGTIVLDVGDADACAQAVDEVVSRHGRIDVLANVAGTGAVASVEETDLQAARELMETNLWGPFALTRRALHHMRSRGRGHIVNVSSLSGRTASAGVAAYAASKFALEGFSEALAAEAADIGVRVSIIEPGGIRTEWVAGAVAGQASESHYRSVRRTHQILLDSRGKQTSSAEDVAAAILRTVDSPESSLRVPVGADAVDRIRSALTADLKSIEQLTRAGG